MSIDRTTIIAAFEQTYSYQPRLVSEAPGRVNLIGEHTDYNGGLVFPVAIDRTVAVAAARRDDDVVRVKSLDFDQCDEFRIDAVKRFMGSRGWRDYVRGVAWALQDENIPLRGCDMVITGDVPQGAGLSSSAAIEVAAAGALAAVAGATTAGRELALVCQKAENLFVGVQCGIMDQLVSVLGKAGHAMLIDCQSQTYEYVPLPEAVAIVIVDSKVPRRLSDTDYNLRREECAQAAQALGMDSLRDATESMLAALQDPLRKRARHVITENERVIRMVDALRTRDLSTAGNLMYDSHKSLRDEFEVSTPELDLLADLSRACRGVIGARLTGAGFGGCTVNLLETESIGRFQINVVDRYCERTGLVAETYVCQAVDGLRVADV